METTEARYLAFMVRGFYNGLLTLRASASLSPEDMETVYALGYNLFTLGNYEAAKEIFTKLTCLARNTAHYWRALGAVLQQTKDYANAIAAYGMAIEVDPSDLVSFVYRGESRLLLGDTKRALTDLERVLRIFEELPDFDPSRKSKEPWAKRSRLLLELHRSAKDSSESVGRSNPTGARPVRS